MVLGRGALLTGSMGGWGMAHAAPLPHKTADTLGFGLDQVSRIGDRVGTGRGERPVTLQESSEP
jgi:hypothetical protein